MSFYSKKYIKGGAWYTTDTPKGSDLSLDKVINEVTGGGGGSSYLVYTAILEQSGTSAPTAVVKENTLGCNITYEYISPGLYKALPSNTSLFTDTNTVLIPGSIVNKGQFLNLRNYYNASPQHILIISSAEDNGTGIINYSNNLLYLTSIEIRVYP
jgi:hypothetical protein